MRSGSDCRFLFLQGPHGPFFHRLAKALRATGAQVWRVGFNLGDRAFWPDRASFIPCHNTPDQWADSIGPLLDERQITDIVLYGDTRPIHAHAIRAAKARGLRVHVFEEGYMRPYWATYERDGSNGHSRLMTLSMDQIVQAAQGPLADQPEAPTHWGDLRQHMFWGAVYHFLVWLGRWRFPAFRSHRDQSVTQEFALYAKRLLLLPFHRWERILATSVIRRGGFPYHLALLQLEHDASFRNHSPYASMTEFLDQVLLGFAQGAPKHHHLVFKAHPLEDGRTALARDIRRLAKASGIARRVHFVRGGKLARLLDGAESAVTINSTAGQQVLWRGLPLKAMGTAVYSKPGLVSDQALVGFFAAPQRPDPVAARAFRRFLLHSSQFPGGYYSAGGRNTLIRRLPDAMLSEGDPYAPLLAESGAAAQQQLRLVSGDASGKLAKRLASS
ncbi:capsule biosynthesis protein [Neogemmobacter tilapiae]|uniref:Capsule biosynthesis protein CapA n=1 Tax=Neogemmobacter tilapiae TaxID=875041 RepID=A0A918WP25_9RHOB|nr:capsular biosynthesis protein [Gemmobacter tilapiae]GHC67078.1 capsule biosynthesis protein CapA [Gemmobacter tilapiae]